MTSSSIINSINSALDDVDFLVSYFSRTVRENDIFKKQRYRLRNLKSFVLFATTLGNDEHLRSNDEKNDYGSLGFLMLWIEDVVRRNARKIHFCCLKLKDPGTDLIRSFDASRAARRIASGFQNEIQSSKDEIDQWYTTMSGHSLQSSSLTAGEVVEFTESILENLVDFPFTRFSKIKVKPAEALREHIKFLTNFCTFVTRRGVEHRQMKDLLTHTEDVAINAAHLCFLCGADNDDEEWRKEMQFKTFMLLQKIKPIDPRVYETYNQALRCSKSSRRLHAPTQGMDVDSTSGLKNFVDSLISILWEMLQLDTCRLGSSKDHGQEVHEELRLLRTILNKLPNNIDEKTWGDIGGVVCDAGVLVCSFYQKNADLGLNDLLERIKLLRAEVKEKDSQTSTFNSPRIHNELDFVDILLETLKKITNDKVDPIVKNRVQVIKEELLFLRSFLEETVDLRLEREELQALWDRVFEALDQVELLIDHLVGDTSNSFSMQFDSIMENIQNIKTDALKSFYAKRQDIKAKEVTGTSGNVRSQKIYSITTEVVGFRDETVSIMDRLVRGSKRLQVIAIVGMPGIGKTTLAAKVYNDPLVVRHFHVRAQCDISQTWDIKQVLLQLLNQIHAENYYEMEKDDLAEKLWRHLIGRRYLIFLDDIWDIEAWNCLRVSFPDDSTGSRIIMTSRMRDTAPLDMLDQKHLCLRRLTDDESFELLQSKLFPGNVWPPTLSDLGMQIVEYCKGLPLTVVLVAGLLAATEQEGWKEIVNSLRSVILSGPEQYKYTLELVYKSLPDHLKRCLLYVGAFPEDQEVPVRRLFRLWIAEGFVQSSEWKSLEDVAEDYMMDLIGRSLIMVAQQRSIGGVKSCRIHDLLREFCLMKAREEAFLYLLVGDNKLLASNNDPCNFQRLFFIQSNKPKHINKLFYPGVRSLLFFSQETGRYEKEASIDISSVIRIFKLVRVLDLEKIYLGDVFPSEIGLLVQLRYLSIRGEIRVIPSSIGNLSRLETFIVDPCGAKVSLPDTIWNLCKLRYLFIRNLFSIENFDNSSVLYELDRLSGIVFIGSSNMEKQMRKFPNIRKLKCRLFKHGNDVEEFQNIVVLDFLSRLESLDMSSYMRPAKNFEFSLPANLKKLTLGALRLPWSKISTIGRLPNLKVLKLLRGSLSGEIWEMEEGEFLNLRYLKLSGLDVASWRASADHIPCLQKLVLEGCLSLEEMPFGIGEIPTLEMIEVSECSLTTTSSVKEIRELQMEMGNVDLKVIIHSSN